MLATATFGSQDARAAVAPPPNVSHAQQSAKPVIVPIIAPRTPVGGRGRALVVPLAPGQSVRDSSNAFKISMEPAEGNVEVRCD